ncbi:MAG: OmpA family protein [Bacteroidetes bacterium]|nr:OmpA family protein [Bacteroidota bacterium]
MKDSESNNKHAYIIPIDIESLVVDMNMLTSKFEFAGQLVDFSLLPHANKGDGFAMPRIRPNISEDLVSKPFESTNSPLKLGVHLHWTLPKEFRRAQISDSAENDNQSEVPKVKYRDIPNRWLIERNVYDVKTGLILAIKNREVQTRKWILESDALFSVHANGSCAFPIETKDDFNEGLPQYKFVGKVYDFEEWQKKDPVYEKARAEFENLERSLQEEINKKSNEKKIITASILEFQQKIKSPDITEEEKIKIKLLKEDEQKKWDQLGIEIGELIDVKRKLEAPENPYPSYLSQLSAFGYGEPLYGAYYPECRNVLGFHDDLNYTLGDFAESLLTEQQKLIVYYLKIEKEINSLKEQINSLSNNATDEQKRILQGKLSFALERGGGHESELKRRLDEAKKVTSLPEPMLNIGINENSESLFNLKETELEVRYVVSGWYSDHTKDPLMRADFSVWRNPNTLQLRDADKEPGYPSGVKIYEQNAFDIDEVTDINEVTMLRPAFYESFKEFGLLPYINAPKTGKSEDLFWFAHLDSNTIQDEHKKNGLIKNSLIEKEYEWIRISGIIAEVSQDEKQFFNQGISAAEINLNFKGGPLEIKFNSFQLLRISVNAKIILSDLRFETGKATLVIDSAKSLDSLIMDLIENPSLRIEIGVHTDDQGDDAKNQELSQLRAQSVVDYLISKKVNPIQVEAKGYGESQPRVPNNSPENRSLNRRVEVRVVSYIEQLETSEPPELNKNTLISEPWKSFFGDNMVYRIEENSKSSLFFDHDFSEFAKGRSVCFGRIKKIMLNEKESVEKFPADNDNKSISNSQTRIVLANTPGQALAALLGATDNEKSVATETLIDAIQLAIFEEEQKLDFPARLKEAIHESGFNSVRGESSWVIQPEKKSEKTWSENQNAATRLKTFPESWNAAIQELNDLQKVHDKICYQIKDRQKQLYADWYKYIIAEYDYTLDEITLEAKVNDIRGYLAREVYSFKSDLLDLKSKRDSLEKKSRMLFETIESWNNLHLSSGISYQLNSNQGPRYWEPKEPVLLFSGPDAIPSKKYKKNENRLFITLKENFFGNKDFQQTLDTWIKDENLFEANTRFPFIDHKEDSWSPLFMDWQVELFPFTKPTDSDLHQKDWPSDSIVANYDLFPGETDIRLQDTVTTNGELFTKWINNDPTINASKGKRLQTIEGRSVLTTGAHLPLVENLKILLQKSNVPASAGLISKLEGLQLLSQNLSGFNDALLMQKQILQLKIKDPLAQTDILANFTRELGLAIGEGNEVAPLPSNLFLPIREGAFRIRKIRMVDMWGRTREFQQEQFNNAKNIIIAESMKPPKSFEQSEEQKVKKIQNYCPGMAYLPPRIVQPARLNFKWLPSGKIESNSENYSKDSPVCGFILPNFLDTTLHVFDPKGLGLGIISRSSDTLVWNPYPGEKVAVETGNYPFLDKFKNSFLKQSPDFLLQFCNAAQASLGATLPANFMQFDGMALLVGRPLALVKASLNLELKGKPAINNSWESRMAAFTGKSANTSPTMGFDKLRFAVRIGEKNKSGDGLFAWFKEDPGTSIDGLFSQFADVASKNPEDFWKKMAILEGWRDIYFDRFVARKERRTEVELNIDSLTNQIDEIKVKSGANLDMEKNPELDFLNLSLTDCLNEYVSLVVETTNLMIQLDLVNKNISEAMQSQTLEGSKGLFVPHSDLLTLSLDEAAIEIGILMDPRSSVQLTTGVLPAKRIELPLEHYAHALNNIQIAFLTTPIISPDYFSRKLIASEQINTQINKFFLISPAQKDYSWSWLQPETSLASSEIPAMEIVQPSEKFIGDYAPQCIFEGWMKLTRNPG